MGRVLPQQRDHLSTPPPPYLSSRVQSSSTQASSRWLCLHLARYSWRVKTNLVMIARQQRVHFTGDRDISPNKRKRARTRSRSLMNEWPSSVR